MVPSILCAALLAAPSLPSGLDVIVVEDRSLQWVEGAIAWRAAAPHPDERHFVRAVLRKRLGSVGAAAPPRVGHLDGGWSIRFGVSSKAFFEWLAAAVVALAAPLSEEERREARARAERVLEQSRQRSRTLAKLEWENASRRSDAPGRPRVLPGWQLGQAALIVVGAVSPRSVKALARRLPWPQGASRKGSGRFTRERPFRSIIVDRPGLVQAEVLLGWTMTSTRWGSPAARAATMVLGWQDDGPRVWMYASGEGGLVERARRLIAERRAVAAQGLSQAQAERGRSRLIADGALSRLDPVRRTDALTRAFLAGEPPNKDEPPTIADIAAAARRIADGIDPILVVVTDADPRRLRSLANLDELQGLEVVPGRAGRPVP